MIKYLHYYAGSMQIQPCDIKQVKMSTTDQGSSEIALRCHEYQRVMLTSKHSIITYPRYDIYFKVVI